MSSDLDEEVENATISFVPQVGDQKKKKKKHQTGRNNNNGDYMDPGNVSSPASGGGYGAPPNNYPAMPGGGQFNNNNMYGQQQQAPPPGPAGFQHFPPPPNFYQNDPYFNGNIQQPYKPPQAYQWGVAEQPMMGVPMVESPVSNYQQYPQAATYAPGQPGAMVLLIQEAPELDFQAPLFHCESCVGCLNHFFLTYCQQARQQNMIQALATTPGACQAVPNSRKIIVNPDRAQEISRNLKSYNGCCAGAFIFDVAHYAAMLLFPQYIGGFSFINGLCIQTIQTRQQVRARFGIAPAQCQDVCVSCWCQPCSSSQTQMELIRRSANPNLVCGDERPNVGQMR